MSYCATEESTYCIAKDTGKSSTGRKVGSHLAKMLDAIDDLDSAVTGKSNMLPDLRTFRRKLVMGLEADGWRKAAKGNKWQVLPPK